MKASVIFLAVVLACLLSCQGNSDEMTTFKGVTIAQIKVDALSQADSLLTGNHEVGKSWQCFGQSAENILVRLLDKAGIDEASQPARSKYMERFRELNYQEAMRLLEEARDGNFVESGKNFKDAFDQCITGAGLGEKDYINPPFNTSWKELNILRLTGDLKWADHMIADRTEAGTMLTIKVDNLLFSADAYNLTLEEMGFSQDQINDRKKRARAVEIEDHVQELRQDPVNGSVYRLKNCIVEYNGFGGKTVTYEDYGFTVAELDALEKDIFTKRAQQWLTQAFAESYYSSMLGYYLTQADGYAENLDRNLCDIAIEFGIPAAAFDEMVKRTEVKLTSAD